MASKPKKEAFKPGSDPFKQGQEDRRHDIITNPYHTPTERRLWGLGWMEESRRVMVGESR